MSPRRTTTRLFALAAPLALVVGLAAGCSSDGSDGEAARSTTTAAPDPDLTAPPTDPTSTTATSAPAEVTSTTAAPSSACTVDEAPMPADATSREIDDVDGDDQADTLWIASPDGSQVRVGITTAAGGSTAVAFDSASPVTRAVLAVDADRQGPTELLFSDGRLVGLHAFVDCTIQPVTNPEGQDYSFGLGFTDVGTGVGCIPTADGQRLAGLDQQGEADGDQVAYTATVVELDGTSARNGDVEEGTYTRPDDDQAIEELHQVTCAGRTIEADGVTLPQ